jgi:hypothetical protein
LIDFVNFSSILTETIMFTPAETQRLQEKMFLKRFMASVLAGSGVLHGFAIGFIYLQPGKLNVLPPEEEIEIVLEDADLAIEPPEAEINLNEPTQVSGSSGGDESLQVATLAPPQAIEAEETPVAAPEELTDADLKETPKDLKETPKPQPTPKPKKSPPPGEKDGDPNGSKERGLAEKTGKGEGTGDKPDGNKGDGDKGTPVKVSICTTVGY